MVDIKHEMMFRPTVWFYLKMWFVGATKHVQYAGSVKCVAYEHKGVFYITKMDSL